MISDQDSLRLRLSSAAEAGSAAELKEMLHSLSPEQRQDVLRHDNAPLLMAAYRGHTELVRMLLLYFSHDLDLELPGTLQLPDSIIQGATALWAASYLGNLDIVSALVEAGADPNASTKSTRSSPLRASCYRGNLHIVQYLVAHGAEVNALNNFNNSGLMIAAFEGHVPIVEFLLDQGAQVDQQACCGASALHFAAESGQLEVVKVLVERGGASTSLRNKFMLTPLMASAEKCQEEVFQFLFSHTVDYAEQISALELIGASFANDKRKYDLAKSFDYLKRAMLMRWDAEKGLLPKSVGPAAEVYGFHQECCTLEQLQEIRQDFGALHMEGLVIRERILGPHHPEVPHAIVYRGAVLADSGHFDRCVPLWLYSLSLKQKSGVAVSTTGNNEFTMLAQVFYEMLTEGVAIDVNHFLQVFNCLSEEMGRCLQRLDSAAATDGPAVVDQHMHCFLYLLVMFTKQMAQYSQAEVKQVLTLCHHVAVKIRPRDQSGRTLLHMVVDKNSCVDMLVQDHVVKFPCAATTKLLLDAGADAQAVDNDGNSALHLIVRYDKIVSDFLTLHSIITMLLAAGAHIDQVNKRGQTAMQSSVSEMAEIVLTSQQKLSLKCLCARAVQAHHLVYCGFVPKDLETFVRLHGPS